MLCEKCHQESATVHLQQIINGNTTELHLCQNCASQTAMSLSFDTFFQGVLDSFLSEPFAAKKRPSIHCTDCGHTYEEFQRTSRLGCNQCYDSFRKELNTVLKNIQGSSQHQGKFPQRSGEELLLKRELENLRLSLSKAVAMEEYEEAAKLRDRIKEMEEKK